MEEQEFLALISRLEAYAHKHPLTYRLKVGLIAALGYVYLFGIVFVILASVATVVIAANILVLKVLIIPLGIAAVIVRSLFVKFPEPRGHELLYADAPKLFDLIDDVRRGIKGPRLYRVVLSDEFTIQVCQRPLLGIFGYHRNYLVIGLPLLQALPVECVRAAIAHEFGHLSGKHGKFSAWVYLVGQTWSQVLAAMEQKKWPGSEIFTYFLAWYAPKFNIYSFVLRRAREYEADRCAAEFAGNENLARALVNLYVLELALHEEFWPQLLSLADEQPEPPEKPFSAMLEALGKPLNDSKAQAWFARSLTARENFASVHPLLIDRLRAIGYKDINENTDISLFTISSTRFADDPGLLDSIQRDSIKRWDRLTKQNLTEPWQQRHDYVRATEKTLAELNSKAESELLTLEEKWERADSIAGTRGLNAAQPYLQEILLSSPEHASASFLLGRAMLEQGDESGIVHLELAMQRDLANVPDGCQLIFSFLRERDRNAEAEPFRKRAELHFEKLEKAQAERKGINFTDKFGPHELAPETLSSLCEQLAKIAPLRQVFLLKKLVRHFPECPLFILAVIGRRPFLRIGKLRLDKQLVSEVNARVDFPGDTLIVALDQVARVMRKEISFIEGAEIYSR